MKKLDQNNDVKPLAAIDSGQNAFPLTQLRSHPGEEAPSVEGWVELCAKAAAEQDPKKLLDLVIEINRLLDAKRKRLLDESDGTVGK